MYSFFKRSRYTGTALRRFLLATVLSNKENMRRETADHCFLPGDILKSNMPAPHLLVPGAIAAVVSATHDCDFGYYDDATVSNVEGATVSNDETPTDSSSGKHNVHFEKREGGGTSNTIRSIESSTLRGSPSHALEGSSLRLSSEGSTVTPTTAQQGFINGDFVSGKIQDIVVDHCFVIAYSSYQTGSALLAVGLEEGLAFYDTTTNSLVHKTNRADMVSALCWTPVRTGMTPEDNSYTSSSHLLAVGGLDGTVSLYVVDPYILEAQGPTLLNEFQLNAQVRTIDCGYYGKLDSSFVVAVGDKSGRVTLVSFSHNLEHIQTDTVQHFSTGVLSVALHATVCGGIIVASTKGGQVFSHELRRHHTGAIYLQRELWSAERDGPVRCVVVNGSFLAFGGYDKKVVLVDTQEWAISREIGLHGTINTIAFDPRGRYFAVGCRDKTMSLFDTSTYAAIKTLNTQGWVTSICWGTMDSNRDELALRPHPTCVTVLDLTPIGQTDIRLSAWQGQSVCVSWARDSSYLARTIGKSIVVADANDGFRDIASTGAEGDVIKISFCQTQGKTDLIASIDESGYLSLFRFCSGAAKPGLVLVDRVFVGMHLKALAWSTDGSSLATGGRGKHLHLLKTNGLREKKEPIELGGRIWDICFQPPSIPTDSIHLAVALGDYTTVLLDDKLEPTLQVLRSRTCRCVAFHPLKPFLAIGDGAETVAIADLVDEEVVQEIDTCGRVNVLLFSPLGDFLLVGSDDNRFRLLETTTFHCIQEIRCRGFAATASFSPNGRFLALGSTSETYSLIRLGPFLDICLIPLNLKNGVESLPEWALNEALYHSSMGPSFLQRHMIVGGADNLRRCTSSF